MKAKEIVAFARQRFNEDVNAWKVNQGKDIIEAYLDDEVSLNLSTMKDLKEVETWEDVEEFINSWVL